MNSQKKYNNADNLTLKAAELLRLQNLSVKLSNKEMKWKSKLPYWRLTELKRRYYEGQMNATVDQMKLQVKWLDSGWQWVTVAPTVLDCVCRCATLPQRPTDITAEKHINICPFQWLLYLTGLRGDAGSAGPIWLIYYITCKKASAPLSYRTTADFLGSQYSGQGRGRNTPNLSSPSTELDLEQTKLGCEVFQADSLPAKWSKSVQPVFGTEMLFAPTGAATCQPFASAPGGLLGSAACP